MTPTLDPPISHGRGRVKRVPKGGHSWNSAGRDGKEWSLGEDWRGLSVVQMSILEDDDLKGDDTCHRYLSYHEGRRCSNGKYGGIFH